MRDKRIILTQGIHRHFSGVEYDVFSENLMACQELVFVKDFVAFQNNYSLRKVSKKFNLPNVPPDTH